MKKLYVGCSLAHAPKEFIEHIDELKAELSKNFEVLQFMGTEKGNVQEVFMHDFDCVKNCEYFLAEVSYPSTGLGFELATAYHANIPTLAVAKHDAKVSRMIQGIDNPEFSFHRYKNIKEVVQLAKEKFV